MDFEKLEVRVELKVHTLEEVHKGEGHATVTVYDEENNDKPLIITVVNCEPSTAIGLLKLMSQELVKYMLDEAKPEDRKDLKERLEASYAVQVPQQRH